ncbi:MAG TPA: SusC/RagA family TonB-linked outer membrane protein [Gemmatimonadaceae bacterium]|nr:SusC/RagA family TonB-linked outer membrane protein [Gemmatimonadaceae bacterium]
MAMVRCLIVPALVGGLLCASQLGAQTATGVITGRVLDSASQQPVSSANVVVMNGQRGALSRDDGTFTLAGVAVGTQTVRVSRIGYRPMRLDVVVAEGATATVDFFLSRQAAVLSEVVVTGYGTQRRESISGAVATVKAEDANVGVVTNVNQMLQSRVAGVQITQNSGEPGAGVQIRIRGGTSISASNDPLYVIDGVPLQNAETTPGASGIGSINAQLARNPLNTINPNDIESITILKDAAATAIYGSRGANGVVLVTTKRATRGEGTMEYETYVGASRAANTLDLASGAEYRSYIQAQAALYTADSVAGKPKADWRGIAPSSLTSLGTADTDWEDAITRTGIATNHNVAFSGGSANTQYRASLNYFDQRGVVLSNGLKRYQGRLNGTHDAIGGKLRLNLNLMASRVDNKFAPIENGGGFLGGLFTNMVIFNPTYPVRASNGSYYEIGTGAQDVRNPVGLVETLQDESPEDRILGNITGTVSLFSNLTTQTTLGVDNTSAVRRTFAPLSSPVGAAYGGFARQADQNLQNLNFQQLVTFSPRFGSSELEMIGGYEYTKFDNQGFNAQAQSFVTDLFRWDNLGSGIQAKSPAPGSFHNESKLVSFFSRANYGFANRYFLTGVLRYDGSSRLAPGHQWELFPAISGSWRISEEAFMPRPLGLSNLSIRAGWGKQGNQSVQPYQTQLLLRADQGASYPFGGNISTGLRAAQVGNPDLKWETATQTNLGVDFAFLSDRITGNFEFYQKDTKDLLLDVPVPQPAVVGTRIENIGSLRNRGFESAIDAELYRSGQRSFAGGLVLTVERNKVEDLGETRQFINTGFVFGQGQSGQYSQRIMLGQPVGTFFGPRFLSVNAQGQQVFACKSTSSGCTNGQTTSPTDEDKEIIGNANPDVVLGLRNNAAWGKLDASWLWRGEFGGEVFNNTALVYQTKGNAKQNRNFLRAALSDPDALTEPSKFSSRWIESRTFVRLQNVTLGYTFDLPMLNARGTRVYLSGDNLLLLDDYTGYDPEVFVASGLASRGIDYLTYPRARTYTFGARFLF